MGKKCCCGRKIDPNEMFPKHYDYKAEESYSDEEYYNDKAQAYVDDEPINEYPTDLEIQYAKRNKGKVQQLLIDLSDQKLEPRLCNGESMRIKPRTPNRLELAENFYVQIYIDYLEISHRLIDDFGFVFKPYIDISIDQIKEEFHNVAIDEEKVDHGENWDLRTSFLQAKEHNFNMNDRTSLYGGYGGANNSILMQNSNNQFHSPKHSPNPAFRNHSGGPMDRNQAHAQGQGVPNSSFLSGIDVNGLYKGSGKEKKHYFRTAKNFYLNKTKNLYSSLIISIKNENPKILQKRPNICIGESRVPLFVIFGSDFKEKECVEVNITSFLRKSQIVGKINAVVSFSNTPFESLSELASRVYFNKKNIAMHDNLLDESIHTFNNSLNWENELLYYNEYSASIINTYFLKNSYYKLDDHLVLYNQLVNERNFDGKILYNSVLLALNNNNMICLQFLFIEMSFMITTDGNSIYDYLAISKDKNDQFFLIPSRINFNPFVMKVYLKFIHDYLKYAKTNKAISLNINRILDNLSIIKLLDECIKSILDQYNLQKLNEREFHYECRDCILWILNILVELISHSTFGGVCDNDDVRAFEIQNIYENAIQILSLRLEILNLANSFINDSQIISNIFRIFRKAVIIMTNEVIQKSKDRSNMQPKTFIKEFKKLMLLKNDGLFLLTCQLVLSKYYHYLELHVNVLYVLSTLTKNVGKKAILFSCEVLDLEVFKESIDFCRGRLYLFGKLIHNLHLNILLNFSDIVNSIKDLNEEQEDKAIKILEFVMKDLRSFFKKTSNYSKIYEDFRERKYIEADIQDLLTTVAVNVSKEPQIFYNLIDNSTFFSSDLIKYLLKISRAGNSPKTFLDFFTDGKAKGMKIERYHKPLKAIVENTTYIILQIFDSPTEIIEKFVGNLEEEHITDAKQIEEIISSCRVNMQSIGVDVSGLDVIFEELKNTFENAGE